MVSGISVASQVPRSLALTGSHGIRLNLGAACGWAQRILTYTCRTFTPTADTY